MQWTEITVSVSPGDAELAADILNEVANGVYIEDYSALEQGVAEVTPAAVISDELLSKDRHRALIHIYIRPEDNPAEAREYISGRLQDCKIEHTVTTDCRDEQAWLNNWRQYYYPVEVGERILIRPTWRELEARTDRVVVDIDPGLAFGTGNHESTRLCLERLEKYVFPGARMLDVGCGSGILSIAAVLLGAQSAFGVDIDPTAVRVANENSLLNHTEDRFGAICGNMTDSVSGKYDIVAANIIADVIIAMSADVPRFLNDGAVFIASGIIDTRLGEVLEVLTERFDVMESVTENGWCCVVARAKKTD